MDLKTYYNNLGEVPPAPKTSFIERVMEDTGKTRITVTRWINGTSRPDKANMEILSKITGIAVDELYPEEVEKED